MKLSLPSHIWYYLLRPVRFVRGYQRVNLQADMMAGLTVAIIMLPQAIAFALIAELPPEMGLYAAIVGAVFGALWGSSNQTQTGPTNAISLLVLSTLLVTAEPGTPEFIAAAGLLTVMVGIFQLGMGLARLGVLVNFVSHSVIVGFSTGAGVLIAAKQIRPLLRLEIQSYSLTEIIYNTATHVHETHLPTVMLGVGTMILIVTLRWVNPKLPSALISMVSASFVVFILGLDKQGVQVIGQLPQNLPPLAQLPLFNRELIAELSTGALAVGSIGLVGTTAIARSISAQTGQRLDSNQEFVGQGLANILSGFFSGYACAGSFARSAVNFKSGAKTPLAAIFSSIFVVLALFTLAPLAAYLPRGALAGVLIVVAYGMIDQEEIKRIFSGTKRDATIMGVTFFGTLFLQIEFAVLAGILLSFAGYIIKTSTPKVYTVLPDSDFRHFIPRPNKKSCPQLGIIDILGDLYFGAANHVEEEILNHMERNPRQRFLLLRMHSVNQCDFSGIHMLESIVHAYREKGGDVYMVRVKESLLKVMKSTGFYDHLGQSHFLSEDTAIEHLFYKVLDPAICVYESNVRVFKECQNLPRPDYPVEITLHLDTPAANIPDIDPKALWDQLHNGQPHPMIIDVREPREFQRGHIAEARLLPLPKIMTEKPDLPYDRPLVLVDRSGRRSLKAAHILRDQGYTDITILEGGMRAWEAANLFEAVDRID